MPYRPFFLLLLLCPLAFVSLSGAQEFYAYQAYVQNLHTHDEARGWGLAYMQDMGKHGMLSFTYLNEGDLANHHRDGYAVQFWARKQTIDRRLSIAAGIGPYVSFDTSSMRSDNANNHAFGGMVSLAVTWRTESRWLLQLRGNWNRMSNGFDTLTVAGGIGYRLDTSPSVSRSTSPPYGDRTTACNELSAFAGAAILNGFTSRSTASEAVEYRRRFTPHLEGTVGLLHEGENKVLNRYGVAGQVWLVRDFFDNRLALGIGLGPYVAYDEHRGRDGSTTVNALLGVTGTYRFSPHWGFRFTWNRVATSYNSDTDVLLGGIAYRF